MNDRHEAVEILPAGTLNWLAGGLMVNALLMVGYATTLDFGFRPLPAPGSVACLAYTALLAVGMFRIRPRRPYVTLFRVYFAQILGQAVIYNLAFAAALTGGGSFPSKMFGGLAIIALSWGWFPASVLVSLSRRGVVLLLAEIFGPILLVGAIFAEASF